MLPDYQTIIKTALSEDVGAGDVTSRLTIPEGARACAVMVVKAPGVVAGLRLARDVFLAVDPTLTVSLLAQDGDDVRAHTQILKIEGSARAILTAERVALNFVQRLSGIATKTQSFVQAVAGTKARICDTRKTTPGLRALEKYAVICGGGVNHRHGLYDMVLIKDNHIAVAGGVKQALDKTRDCGLEVEIEVDTLDQLQEALAGGATRILLDNMPPETLARAVEMTAGRAVLEASGGVTFESVRAVAESGVDLISVGALTHSATALDIGLDIQI